MSLLFTIERNLGSVNDERWKDFKNGRTDATGFL